MVAKKRASGQNRQKQGVVSPNPKTPKGPLRRTDRTTEDRLSTRLRPNTKRY